MAGDSGSSFPFAALSVVALFLSTTFWAQHGFDAWRPSDTDASKRLQLTYPPVEARLWEDPLGALDRHRQRFESCAKQGRTAAAAGNVGRDVHVMDDLSGSAATDRGADVTCQTAQPIDRERFRDSVFDRRDTTLIAAMLPGAAFVGAEELRRRFRYAVLTGLNVAGFVPDDSERMGLVRVQRCETLAGCAKDNSAQMDVAYETLTGPAKRAVVLWIDDTAVGRRWLSAITMMFADLTRATTANPSKVEPTLRVIGPSGSDLLVRALAVDLPGLVADRGAKAEVFKNNYEVLRNLRLISPLSTTPDALVRLEARLPSACDDEYCLDSAFKHYINVAAPPDVPKLDGKTRPFFVRTIGTDDLLVTRLVEELKGRGLCQDNAPKKRVILINEWDSVYARTFSGTLKDALSCKSGSKIELQSYSYLRGLDGATLGSSTQQARSNERKADTKLPVEWPEGRPQADYVRRLVEEILKDNAKHPVHAVGMIGSDVHDKLVLAQALRGAFPDRVLFTTDMDARLLHPSVTRYTRNVIVASSLPLEVPEAVSTPAADGNWIGPFRDSYQTAQFFAARLAVEPDATVATSCGGKNDLECSIRKVVATPSLFEIGRSGMVDLQPKGVGSADLDKRHWAAMVALTLFLILIWVLLVVYPGGAMKHAWLWWSGEVTAFPFSYAIVAALEVAAMAFAIAVVAELLMLTSAGPWVPALAAASAAILFLAAIAVRPTAPQPGTAVSWTGYLAKVYVIALIAVVPLAVEYLATRHADSAMREPFAILSGVSAWPSQLLRALAILLFGWFLDEIWCESTRAAERLEDKYQLYSTEVIAPAGVMSYLWQVVSVWCHWKPDVLLSGDRVDGARLWREYRLLMDGKARALRILVWTTVTGVAIYGAAELMNGLIDETFPEVPARGAMDRDLFHYTVWASAAAVIVLLVTVADLTILTTRFVGVLKLGRTVYPPKTIDRFAAELGPQLEAAARSTMAASPNQRSDSARPRPDRNSLLDDWIDSRLLAEHTEVVGRFIIFPFILVGLLVVARSALFDNWYVGGAVLAGFVVYLLWSIAMATVLNYDAEQARKKALRGMEADLRWLRGANAPFDKLRDTFDGLINQVRNLRQGAFAPFFEKPIVQAILVPLGGAGGVQLIQLLMYARSQ
jgi:hypothetical protein